jgi:hypothetical protein
MLLIAIFDPLFSRYNEVVTLARSTPGGVAMSQYKAQVVHLEYQLAWLVYVMASIAGGQAFRSTAFIPDGEEVHDAHIQRRLFSLMQALDMRTSSTGGGDRPDVRLERAMLYFVTCFRKAFLSDQSALPPQQAASGSGTSEGDGSPQLLSQK